MIDRKLNYGRHHIKRFLEATQPLNTVIDLGAGQGDDLQLAHQACATSQCHAVEVYPPYVAKLQQAGVTVHQLNIERDRLPFADNSVDAVIMNQIMEHVKEVYWICHEVTRILRVGGAFMIGVPNLAAFHNRGLLLLGKQPTPLKNWSAHVRGWTLDDFKKLFANCYPNGYELKDFGGSNFYPFPPVLAKPLAAVMPNMAWGIFMNWVKRNQPYSRQFLDYPAEKRLETNFYLGA